MSMFQKIPLWVGSGWSLAAHTLLFCAAAIVGFLHIAPWETVLLVLTTAVSLEAIYLAIFIQMAVNQQAVILKEVEQDVDAIQENVDEIQEDVGEIQEDIDAIEGDVDEIQEDVDEIQEDLEDIQEDDHQKTLENIVTHLQKILEDIDKKKKGV